MSVRRPPRQHGRSDSRICRTATLIRILNQANLPHVRFDDLRPTCASLLVAQVVHARMIIDILGRSCTGETMGTYSHIPLRLQEDAADRMDQVLVMLSDGEE